MKKKPRTDENEVKLTVTLSRRAYHLLLQLRQLGIYGISREDVAARLIDRGLIELFEKKQAP